MPRARTKVRRSPAQKAALAKAQLQARERRANPLAALLAATRQRAQTANNPDLRARLARERVRAKDFARKLKEERGKAERAAKEVDALMRVQKKCEREARKAEDRAGRSEKAAEASRRIEWEACERANAAERLLGEERQMKELWRALYMRSEMQGARAGGSLGGSSVGRILQEFSAPVPDHDDILSKAAPWKLPHSSS